MRSYDYGLFFQGSQAYSNHFDTTLGASTLEVRNTPKNIYHHLTCTAICVPLDVANNVTGRVSVVTKWCPCCWCPISDEALWNAAKSWATIATFKTKGRESAGWQICPHYWPNTMVIFKVKVKFKPVSIHKHNFIVQKIHFFLRKVAITVFSKLSISTENINIFRTAEKFNKCAYKPVIIHTYRARWLISIFIFMWHIFRRAECILT